MKKIISLLKNKRGESMVEILVSIVMFIFILATLAAAISFATNAQHRSEKTREDFAEIQRELRNASPTGTASTTYNFNAISIDGSEVGTEVLFSVDVILQTKAAAASSGASAEFAVFGTDKALEGGGTP